MTLTEIVLWIPVAAVLIAAAGYLIAVEDMFTATRERFENWAYINGGAVRANSPDADQFWGRARPWTPTRGLRNRPLNQFNTDVQVVPDSNGGVTLQARRPTWADGRKLNRVDLAATIIRTKAADASACPKCVGWWASIPPAAVLAYTAGLPIGIPLLCAHLAGWGLFRIWFKMAVNA